MTSARRWHIAKEANPFDPSRPWAVFAIPLPGGNSDAGAVDGNNYATQQEATEHITWAQHHDDGSDLPL